MSAHVPCSPVLIQLPTGWVYVSLEVAAAVNDRPDIAGAFDNLVDNPIIPVEHFSDRFDLEFGDDLSRPRELPQTIRSGKQRQAERAGRPLIGDTQEVVLDLSEIA
jgi:hypothetical protein